MMIENNLFTKVNTNKYFIFINITYPLDVAQNIYIFYQYTLINSLNTVASNLHEQIDRYNFIILMKNVYFFLRGLLLEKKNNSISLFVLFHTVIFSNIDKIHLITL
jgi:hypothetical protein